VRFEWLEKMVERSEDLELFDLRGVEDLLGRTVGHHGHGRLRKAIALYKPTSFTRSEDLLLVGIGMTRVTGPRLEREPAEVIRRVGLLLEQWRVGAGR
jgi:hypothetical protein